MSKKTPSWNLGKANWNGFKTSCLAQLTPEANKNNEDNANNENNSWQSEMNLCERNLHMLEHELETDITFKASSPQDGKYWYQYRILLIENKATFS